VEAGGEGSGRHASPDRVGFSHLPAVLAGRDDVLEAADEAIAVAALDARTPTPLPLLGARGVGKTVLLEEIANRAAAAHGWPRMHVELRLVRRPVDRETAGTRGVLRGDRPGNRLHATGGRAHADRRRRWRGPPGQARRAPRHVGDRGSSRARRARVRGPRASNRCGADHRRAPTRAQRARDGVRRRAATRDRPELADHRRRRRPSRDARPRPAAKAISDAPNGITSAPLTGQPRCMPRCHPPPRPVERSPPRPRSTWPSKPAATHTPSSSTATMPGAPRTDSTRSRSTPPTLQPTARPWNLPAAFTQGAGRRPPRASRAICGPSPSSKQPAHRSPAQPSRSDSAPPPRTSPQPEAG
jgi:hypothetical protein